MKKISKKSRIAAVEEQLDEQSILFNGNMRKMLVEGVLQDIKGYIDSKTNGLVEVTYEDYNIGTQEFGFKLFALKTKKCKMQMFHEATAAIVSAVNYMFQGNNEQYDISIFTEDDKLEVEFVSNW